MRRIVAPVLLGLVAALACGAPAPRADEPAPAARGAAGPPPEGLAAAVFAGGCFWCMEGPFDALPGVVSTTSGYTGGHVESPRYEEVSQGGTGHAEAVRVVYDPEEVGYEELLRVFWRNVDPLDAGGQFCDRGPQYRSAVFVQGDEERRLALASKAELEERFGEPIATEVVPAGPFYPAEAYHQDYYREHPLRYRFYRTACGRDRRLEAVWGDEAGH